MLSQYVIPKYISFARIWTEAFPSYLIFILEWKFWAINVFITTASWPVDLRVRLGDISLQYYGHFFSASSKIKIVQITAVYVIWNDTYWVWRFRGAVFISYLLMFSYHLQHHGSRLLGSIVSSKRKYLVSKRTRRRSSSDYTRRSSGSSSSSRENFTKPVSASQPNSPTIDSKGRKDELSKTVQSVHQTRKDISNLTVLEKVR